MRSQWWKAAHRTYSGCSVPGVGTINRGMQLVKESACLISKVISLPQRNYWQKQEGKPPEAPRQNTNFPWKHRRLAQPWRVSAIGAEQHCKPCDRLQAQKQHIGAGNSSSPRDTDWGRPPPTEICRAHLLKNLKPWKKHEPETMLAVNFPPTQILPRTKTKWKQTTEPHTGISHY